MTQITAPTFLVKLAKGKNVLLLFALFLAFAGGIMPALEADIKALSGGVGVLDLEFYYSPNKALSSLRAYGPEGIRLYLIAQWTVDFIFPVIGGLFFATALIWVGARRWFWLGPLLTAVDWMENVFISIMLVQIPDFHAEMAVLSCTFTVAKWSLILIMNAFILIHGVVKLRQKLQNATAKVNREVPPKPLT
jgi:hypothetical protein